METNEVNYEEIPNSGEVPIPVGEKGEYCKTKGSQNPRLPASQG